jgi:hypothetical protein
MRIGTRAARITQTKPTGITHGCVHDRAPGSRLVAILVEWLTRPEVYTLGMARANDPVEFRSGPEGATGTSPLQSRAPRGHERRKRSHDRCELSARRGTLTERDEMLVPA